LLKLLFVFYPVFAHFLHEILHEVHVVSPEDIPFLVLELLFVGHLIAGAEGLLVLELEVALLA